MNLMGLVMIWLFIVPFAAQKWQDPQVWANLKAYSPIALADNST